MPRYQFQKVNWSPSLQTIPGNYFFSMASKPISDGLEPVLSFTKNHLQHRQLPTNIKIKIIKLIPVLIAWGLKKSGFNLIIVHFVSAKSCV